MGDVMLATHGKPKTPSKVADQTKAIPLDR